MRLFKFVFLTVLLAAAVGTGWILRDRRQPDPTATAAATAGRKVLYYVDPMHPSYTSDKPGIAPDCGMALEPVYADDGVAPTPATRRVLYYRDPKVPAYTATTAGINPETGNTLEPVYADAPAASSTAGAVRISTDRQQLAGVRYATVEATDVGRTLRTVGRVAYDETKVQHVHPRVDGWIETGACRLHGPVGEEGAADADHLQPRDAGLAGGTAPRPPRARGDAEESACHVGGTGRLAVRGGTPSPAVVEPHRWPDPAGARHRQAHS